MYSSVECIQYNTLLKIFNKLALFARSAPLSKNNFIYKAPDYLDYWLLPKEELDRQNLKIMKEKILSEKVMEDKILREKVMNYKILREKVIKDKIAKKNFLNDKLRAKENLSKTNYKKKCFKNL